MNNKQCAGKPIAAGGFGCVFEPSLKCKNNTQNVPNGISKLMTKRDVTKEFSEFKRVIKFTKEIPNNSNYFLLSGIKKCDSLKK